MRREWLLVVASVLVAVALIEGGMRLYYAVSDLPPPHPDASLQNEWAWAHAHLRAGVPVMHSDTGYDPDLGWRPGGDVDAWIRQKGWGLPDGDLLERNERRRVMFIGDSFTFGLYVADAESFAVRLGADHLPDHEIINLGVSGYGPDQMLLLYERLGRRYRPDIVVMGFYVRGFARAKSRFTFYAKPSFDLGEGAALSLRGTPVIAPEVLYEQYRSGARRIAPWPYSYLWASVAASAERIGTRRRIDGPNEGGWPLMTALLRRFAAAVRSDRAIPVLLIIPSRLEDYRDSVNEDMDRLARDDACRFGILPVSLADPFFAATALDPQPPLFRDQREGGHFSARGHALAAAELGRALAQPSPCASANGPIEPQATRGPDRLALAPG